MDPENEATGKANKEGEGREGGGERREGDLPCESAEGGSCESAEGGSDEKELEGIDPLPLHHNDDILIGKVGIN